MGIGANRPIDLTLTGYVRSIVAVDVPRGWTVAFDLTTESKKMTVTAPSASSGYYTATGTATLLVSDGNTQTITKSLELKCNTAYTPPAAPDIKFDQPESFTNGETKVITLTEKTSTVKNITPVDVPRGWTVTPDVEENKITVIAPANDGKYYTAAGTVKLLVSDDAARTTIKPLTLSCPAYTPPEKLGITFDQPPLFGYSQVKEVGFTTQGNATTVKVLDVPTGWDVTVAKQSDAGTFTVTAPAEDNAGEAIVLAADAAGNTVIRTLNLTAYSLPFAASTQTWTFDSQTWSDAIQIPDCNKSDFDTNYTEPRCRSYTLGKLRYYYNWSYVAAYAATLCPSPWQVPSQSDFNALVSATNYSTLFSEWGYGGFAYGGSMNDVSTSAYYWSSTQIDSNRAYYLNYASGNLGVTSNIKNFGFQVRCVK
jgi:uncharacterized protein YbdZ (MbtH family)